MTHSVDAPASEARGAPDHVKRYLKLRLEAILSGSVCCSATPMTDDWVRAVALASAGYITLGYLACFSVLLYLAYRQCAAHPPHDYSVPIATSATQGQRIGETHFFALQAGRRLTWQIFCS